MYDPACINLSVFFFFFQAEDGIRDVAVTGVQTCALPISAADRIVKVKRLNACLTPISELRKSLVAQASAAHPSGVLYGMPVAVKDNICTLEFTTSCGSKILEGYRSPYEATAVAKLKAAGAAHPG